MKFYYSLVALASIAAPAVAQFGNIPACAANCALGALPASCGGNLTCVCEATAFIVGLEPCVQTACSPADQTSALVGAESLCAGYGVTLSVPTAPASSSSATTTPSITPPPTSTKASNVTAATSPPSVFTGAAPQAQFFVSGAFLAGAGFLLALF